MADDDGILTTPEVARLYRADPLTVRRWAAQGLIPSFRTPSGRLRFRASELAFSQSPAGPDDTIGPAEVAAMTGIHPKTVSRLADSGDLPCLPGRTPGGHRRFSRAAVLAFLTEGKASHA